MKGDAVLSSDRKYRYVLRRQWERDAQRQLVLIGLNPSTADETQDDPTIRRCIGFAKREGCGALVMLNLFAYRSTQPALLYQVKDPVGPENDAMMRKHWLGPFDTLVLAAWGVQGSTWPDRIATVCALIGAMNCLGTTKNGQPRHPLYVRHDAPMYPWSEERR